MIDPTAALTTAIENSAKVANTPLFSTVIDKLLGFKISEWNAQGETIKKNILDGYEEAKQRGLGLQYVTAFRSNTNLINIGAKASKYIDSDTHGDIEVDNDVFWGFLEHAKEISNEEMQELIAKIIAGEYNVPGTYSMSVLQIIKMLGKHELELFEKMCGLLVNGAQLPKALFTGQDNLKPLIQSTGLDFGKLQILQSMALFLPNDMSITIANDKKKKLAVQYFEKQLIYSPEGENTNIKFPDHYGLSIAGEQILKHLKPKYVAEYYQWLKANYRIGGYKLEE